MRINKLINISFFVNFSNKGAILLSLKMKRVRSAHRPYEDGSWAERTILRKWPSWAGL